MSSDGRDRETVHDRYVQYMDARLNMVILATLGVLTLVVGFDWSTSSLHVQTMGEWYTVDAQPGFIYGSFVSTLGVVLLVSANKVRFRAKTLRASWKARRQVELMYSTTVAAVILNYLTEVNDDEVR